MATACLELVMVVINHTDDALELLLCNMYHKYEQNLRQIVAYGAAKMIVVLNIMF